MLDLEQSMARKSYTGDPNRGVGIDSKANITQRFNLFASICMFEILEESLM